MALQAFHVLLLAAGGIVLPEQSTEVPPERGTLAFLGFDSVCHQRMPELAALFRCPHREPALDATLGALDGEALSSVGEADVETALRHSLRSKNSKGEVDIVFIDTRQRIYWVTPPTRRSGAAAVAGPNWELKDKAHTFLLLLSAVLRKLKLDLPLIVRISRHTPNEKKLVMQDPVRDSVGAILRAAVAGLQHDGAKLRLPLLEMHIRAKDLQHGFGIPSVLLSWMSTALYPWPARLRQLVAEANVRAHGSAAAKLKLKTRKARRRKGTERKKKKKKKGGTKLMPWSKRKSKLVWRGGTTGMRSFLNLPSAIRLDALQTTSRARLMAVLDECNDQSIGARSLKSLFDVGYHKVHSELSAMVEDNEDRKGGTSPIDLETSKFVEWLKTHVMPFVSTVDQARYKYQLSVDGLAAPWRLSLQIILGGAILKQEGSLFHEFYAKRLEAGRHYLPLKKNLEDLPHVTAWALENDAAAQAVAKNAHKFARSWLSAEALLCYVARLISTLSEKQALPVGWRPAPEVAHLSLVFDPDSAAKATHSHASTSALAKMHHHAHGPKAKSRPCPVAPRDGRLKKMKNAAADDVLTNMLLGKPKPKLSSTLVAPSKLCEQHCHGFVEYEKCFGMCTRDNCRGMCKGLGNM